VIRRDRFDVSDELEVGGDRLTESTPREYVGLLTQVMTNTLDADYATVAEQRRRSRGDGQDVSPGSPVNKMAVLAVLAVFGLMIGVSALKTDQDRPETEAERAELVTQIHKLEDDQSDVSSRINRVQDDVTRLQSLVGDEISRNSTITDRLQTLGVDAGTLPVTGPGLVITTDDAPASYQGSGGTILDSDLQILVNGLWAAGAEAVAIDGHRLTALTSIRLAGSAITVDNVSLSPPYVISAIGDPDTLPARLLETDGGQTWLGLEANFGITFERQTKENVSVPADPHEHLLYAEPAGGR
jgi:uncharacterized protein YlxW (UPF0749 family)